MCGIAGIVTKKDSLADRDVLRRMCDAIRHRGPDDEGQFVEGRAAIGMRRLSIIDRAGGHQPIANETRTAWIVFNGEIYNYLTLRPRLEDLGHRFETDSDTEVILHAYEEFGEECPKYLRGMFAFAIWDKQRQELFLARDRMGKKPLLYAEVDGEIAFASEFSALLQHPRVGREVNADAIHYYLSFMAVPAPLTAYASVRKLQPAHTLTWRDGQSRITRYWQPNFTTKTHLSEREASDRAIELLRDAVRVRLMSEVPLGAFLSGGIDSSTVVALMAEQSGEPVKTFSIGFEEQDFSELAHARRIAQHFGAEHHEFVVRPDVLEVLPTLVEHYGEPYADSSAIPTYYVARETRRHVTVALNGDGGDECFGGYERYAAMGLAERYRKLPEAFQWAARFAVEALPTSEIRRSRARDLKRFVRAAALPALDRYERWMSIFDNAAKDDLYTEEFKERTAHARVTDFLRPWFASGLGVVDAALLADTMTYLPNDLLVKVDIASMAVSLEARSPFLDHHVMEFAASLPEAYKVRWFTTKILLKRHMLPDLIPRENIHRRKMGFGLPITHWLRKELLPLLRETLLSDRASRRGLFRREVVSRMIEDHASGRRDLPHQLWTLLMLELWFVRFIDSATAG